MTVEWRLRDGSDSAVDLQADGDGRVTVPFAPDLNPGTASFAVSVQVSGDFSTSSDTYPNVFVVRGGNGAEVAYRGRNDVSDSYVLVDTDSTSAAASYSGPTDVGPVRVTLVVDRDADEARVYWGRDLVKTDAVPAGEAITLDGDLVVGHESGKALNADLVVDDLRWYDRALSDAEVRDVDEGERVADGLVLHLPFDDGTATDASGSGNDGTLENGVSFTTDANPFALDDDLLDVSVTDALNRFARQATATLDDATGRKAETYRRPTPVDLEVKAETDSSFGRRFGGFVVNPKSEGETTELEVLSHDFWLRKRRVFQSFTDTAISTILNDLVVDLTPLDWVASNVTVVNDETLSRDWKGERLDEVVSELAAISANEEFGANDAGEFFFRPRESDSAPQNFGVGQYAEADFEEDAKREVNKVTLYYGEGSNTGAVAVQDRASQKELADELGRPRPVVIGVTKAFPEIGTEKAAERKARKLLNDRSVVQTGSLTTWEAFDVDPGDVTRVVVPDQDVDQDFRVAEISYAWQDDETELKLAENTDGVLDTLVSLSNEVSRIDSRAADESATITQFVELRQAVGPQLQLTAYKRTVPSDQLLLGETKGGWGDPAAGGGRWGDQRGSRQELV